MESEDICAICFNEFDSSPGIRLSCSHSFHFDCMTNLKTLNMKIWKNCSLCRKELNCSDVLKITNFNRLCGICNEPYFDSNPMYFLSCLHKFHFGCLRDQENRQHCLLCGRNYYDILIEASFNHKMQRIEACNSYKLKF